MQPTLKAFACGIGTVAISAVGLVAGFPAVATASETMSAPQQNELLRKYCVVCHNDEQMKGHLSLEHFDAANPDRTVAAMMLSKVRDGGAISAAGTPLPDS